MLWVFIHISTLLRLVNDFSDQTRHTNMESFLLILLCTTPLSITEGSCWFIITLNVFTFVINNLCSVLLIRVESNNFKVFCWYKNKTHSIAIIWQTDDYNRSKQEIINYFPPMHAWVCTWCIHRGKPLLEKWKSWKNEYVVY